MNEDENLRRYGLRPSSAHLPEIRRVLLAAAERDQQDQDTELMKLCCSRAVALESRLLPHVTC